MPEASTKLKRKKNFKALIGTINSKGIRWKMQNITLKTQNVVEGRKKCRLFSMYLNLNDYPFKSSRYNYGSIYVKPTVATNQKPIADT